MHFPFPSFYRVSKARGGLIQTTRPATILPFQAGDCPDILTLMNRFLTFTLALLIAVSLQQKAKARGSMSDAAGQVAQCTGQGTKTVTVDRTGNPMDVVQICPDYTLALVCILDELAAGEAPVPHIQTLGQTPTVDLQIALVLRASHPRGPPLPV